MAHTGHGRRPHRRQGCRLCSAVTDHDKWNAAQRGETPLQRADRAYAEILQEIRVAQTGVQILFAFLLTLPFQTRFASVTQSQRDIYAVTLMLSAAAAALLIAPAAFHRVVYRRRLKLHLVRLASRLALSGLVLLMLSLASAVLLILDVVFGFRPAAVIATGTFSWFFAWWFVVPVCTLIRHATMGYGRQPEPSSEVAPQVQAVASTPGFTHESDSQATAHTPVIYPGAGTAPAR